MIVTALIYILGAAYTYDSLDPEWEDSRPTWVVWFFLLTWPLTLIRLIGNAINDDADE